MVILDRLPTSVLMVLALAAWLAYLAICAAPAGAPFIYAEF